MTCSSWCANLQAVRSGQPLQTHYGGCIPTLIALAEQKNKTVSAFVSEWPRRHWTYIKWQQAVNSRDEELRMLIGRAFHQAGVGAGLNRDQFSEALTNTDVGAMFVTIDASMY